MRISDWSSDVCSSDLSQDKCHALHLCKREFVNSNDQVKTAPMTECQGRFFILKRAGRLSKSGHSLPLQPSQPHRIVPRACCSPVVLCARTKLSKIGRESGRERVCEIV